MNTIRLRGGYTTTDVRLGRVPQHDDRNSRFPIRALLDRAARPRSYTWRLGTHLDQQQTPMCVGFSIAHELAARPVVCPVDPVIAAGIYSLAQKNDDWAGEAYEGTSVLGGAKATKLMGFYDEYRWASGVDDFVLAVGYHGPAVIGINWYATMFHPDETGRLVVAGGVAGGHAILCNRVDVKNERAWLCNSWGLDWGIGGNAWLPFTDLSRLLGEDGEAMIPVTRERG